MTHTHAASPHHVPRNLPRALKTLYGGLPIPPPSARILYPSLPTVSTPSSMALANSTQSKEENKIREVNEKQEHDINFPREKLFMDTHHEFSPRK